MGQCRSAISMSKRRERCLRVSFSLRDFMSGSFPWLRSRKWVCNSTVESQRGDCSYADDECGTRTEFEGARCVRVAASQRSYLLATTSWFAPVAHLLRAMSSEAFSPTLPPTATATSQTGLLLSISTWKRRERYLRVSSFAARFHERIAPLVRVAKEGLQLDSRKSARRLQPCR